MLFSISAERLYNIAYVVLILSLIVGAIATAASFFAGNKVSRALTIRLATATQSAGRANERAAFLEKEAAEARERTAALERATEQARMDAAQADERASAANERTASLALELEKARAEAARADANLLAEQRLTARERMRLERLESAVLPRHLLPQQYNALVSKLKGLAPVNIAIVKRREPQEFGTQFILLFQDAGILGSGPINRIPARRVF